MTGSKRPNVVCFIMDQLRYDHLGFMGNDEVDTPNIDKLADEGVVFERAYVANPLCMPARATLFTGQTPRGHGVRTNGIPLNPEIPTMPEALRKSGYRTHAVGKLHLSNYGLPRGDDVENIDSLEYPECKELWDKGINKELPTPYYGLESVDFLGGHVSWVFGEYLEWIKEKDRDAFQRLSFNHPENKKRIGPECFNWTLPEEYHYNRWITERSSEFLEEAAEDEKPFFLWCSFPDPHHPFAAPEPWGSMYDPADISLERLKRKKGELKDLPPFYQKAYEDKNTVLSGLHGNTRITDKELKDIIAVTYGMISFVDHEIGMIVDKLDNLGLRENTIIVFMADHGDMMGDHWMQRKGPFQFEGLLRMPFVWNFPGRFPKGHRPSTLASQIDFAPTILDLCQVPIPEGKTPTERESKMEVKPWPGKSLKPVLEGSNKRINDYVIVENDEDYLGLRVRSFITERYKLTVYPGHSYGELFDLKKDPGEINNLWNNSAYKEIKTKLYKKFLEAYILQDSPLPRRLCHA